MGSIEVAKYLQSCDWGKNKIKAQKGNTPMFAHM
tara:strand:- start:98 stop:199 length:102 start_codon:yes stop_codon:yes gene_type:complete